MDVKSASDQLKDAQNGFNLLFIDNIAGAKEALRKEDSPFHATGLGIICFIQAALGLEKELMPEASELLTKAEQNCKTALKSIKSHPNGNGSTRFSPGLEYEILLADAVVFNGLVHALNESYVGLVKALYALYNANSKFTKLFKNAFPDGIPGAGTSAGTLQRARTKPPSLGIIGRLGSNLSSRANSRPTTPGTPIESNSIDDFVFAGSAFGYGLFSLAMSLLPSRVRSLVGWFGLQTDRQLALQALMFAASKEDVHAVFASITLMQYWDVVLALSGWQAEETEIVARYTAILEPLERRYAGGSLWSLYKAKLELMNGDFESAMQNLQSVVLTERTFRYKQADALLIFELAWTSFGQRDYLQAADLFVKMTNANNWSHATYSYIAAGCYLAAGDTGRSEELLARVIELLKTTLKAGKELPAEAFVRKRISFYESKLSNNHSCYSKLTDCMVINIAEEIAVFWNIHNRISINAAESRIKYWANLNPAIKRSSSPVLNGWHDPSVTKDNVPLVEDEITLRDFLLGIVHRTARYFTTSREFLERVTKKEGKVQSGWMVPLSAFELAVLELQEANAKNNGKEGWTKSLKAATGWLAKSSSLCSNSLDMSTRLEIRISMLQDEIKIKQAQIDR